MMVYWFISRLCQGYVWLQLRRKQLRIEGLNNIPNHGPYLVVSNHFGGESPVLLGVLANRQARFITGYELNWQRSCLNHLFQRCLKSIPIYESLSHLTPIEQEKLLQRVPAGQKRRGYQRVLNKRADWREQNQRFLKTAVDRLVQGNVLVMFPEGLLTFESPVRLKRGYRGAEYIATQFEQRTGTALPLLPIAISPPYIRIGECTPIPKNTQGSVTEWMMGKLADLLSTEQWGV